MGECVAGMSSSVNSDVRRYFRRRYSQISVEMGSGEGVEGTVYFPKASVGPGFFHVLSV